MVVDHKQTAAAYNTKQKQWNITHTRNGIEIHLCNPQQQLSPIMLGRHHIKTSTTLHDILIVHTIFNYH